jgi:alpha-L-fucosidase
MNHTNTLRPAKALLLGLQLAVMCVPLRAADTPMDRMWGESSAGATVAGADRAALFRDGNYGMFIHWGLYSHLGGRWKDQTLYGISEWIMQRMKIPSAEYMAMTAEFDPSDFDAREIVELAKQAGMKWIIITSKHHDGFAMFKSKHPFNIVDATPAGRDPMMELAVACREAGLGFGFYYSHYQDWTAPGGNGGPSINADGTRASFEQYFREKCLPQVQEICTQYGPLDFVWFDTPGAMPKELVIELADYVRRVQPGAMLCSRIGHGMGDYASKGDMEVPLRNIDGLWETCDTTNDTWGFSSFDQNWKDSREILRRLVSTVARGGSYLLNIGPDGRGRVPPQPAKYLIGAGQWIQRYPQVVHRAGASPWGHALPWGDVTTDQAALNLVVFDWPGDGRLWLPGLATEIASAGLLADGGLMPLAWERIGTWTVFQLPSAPPDRPASVITVQLRGEVVVEQTHGLVPGASLTLPVEFAEVTGATKKRIAWMEKFGEWKFATQASDWGPTATVTWIVDVAVPGDHRVELIYKGEGRLVWSVEIEGGDRIENEQAATAIYHAYPQGVVTLRRPGKHRVSVSLLRGAAATSSLEAIRLVPMK